MKYLVLLTSYVLLQSFLHAQTIHQLTSKEKISLRGLSVVNNNIIWASGSNGQVVKSTDGGNNFTWMTVKGYEKRDFRDVKAFDSNTAIIITVDVPAIILKTKDGGKTWKEVFHDDTKGMFLDAMDFADDGMARVVVFAKNLEKASSPSQIAATAEDANHHRVLQVPALPKL